MEFKIDRIRLWFHFFNLVRTLYKKISNHTDIGKHIIKQTDNSQDLTLRE